jgi:hypothetical protein
LFFPRHGKPCIYGACHSITEARNGTQPSRRIGGSSRRRPEYRVEIPKALDD